MKPNEHIDNVMHEITPLMDRDVLYIADRHKKEFDYPIHCHSTMELNFVEHAAGVRRIVGDSYEVIGDYDMVLITGPTLEHVWLQHECHSEDIHEITVHFDFDNDINGFFGKKPFTHIRRMLDEARKGLAFPLTAIMQVYNDICALPAEKDGFSAVMKFLNILHKLATTDGAYTLASTSFAKVRIDEESQRILKVKDYITKNYRDEIRLSVLAKLACMSESAFSRYFKLHTGRTVSEFIMELRLGYASRMLVDTTKSIAEISFQCGYNNLSHFNRVFRRKKGCSPGEFRSQYRKTKIII